MADEIELLHDGEGLAVLGDTVAVRRFLDDKDLWKTSQEFPRVGLGSTLSVASGVADAASTVMAQSSRYVRLTEESARDIRTIGLVPTDSKGVSYAMVGQPGSIAKWLKIETGAASWLTNPAVLSGAAGIMAQLARQQEMKELERLLESIYAKLDDVRRRQRDEVLAQMDGSTMAIEEAGALRESGGDMETAWRKVEHTKGIVFEVEANALRELQALSEKVSTKEHVRDLKKRVDEVAQETALWLAVLAKCFRLEDQHEVLELDHVASTSPSSLDTHRIGLEEARHRRRDRITAATGCLLEHLEHVGGVTRKKIILHGPTARAVVGSVNSACKDIAQFREPFGVEAAHTDLTVPGWVEALRDPEQWEAVREERGSQARVAFRAVLALGAVALLASGQDGDSDDDE